MNNKKRWQQRFDNFESAYHTFCRMIQSYEDNKLAEVNQMALVQSFEFTIELAWKTLKDYLEDAGYKNTDTPKETIRQGFQAGLLSDADSWMEGLRVRNLSSHTYHFNVLAESVAFIYARFYPLVGILYELLKKAS